MKIDPSDEIVGLPAVVARNSCDTSPTAPHGRRWLSGFLDRVREVNANDEYLFQVDEVIVFGSYLDDSVDRLSDVDVVVELSRRHPEKEFRDRSDARVRAAQDEGRRYLGSPSVSGISTDSQSLDVTRRSGSVQLAVHPRPGSRSAPSPP